VIFLSISLPCRRVVLHYRLGHRGGTVLTVPASVIGQYSSDDVTAREGDSVVLRCNVTGIPRPEVTWYRRHRSSTATTNHATWRTRRASQLSVTRCHISTIVVRQRRAMPLRQISFATDLQCATLTLKRSGKSRRIR